MSKKIEYIRSLKNKIAEMQKQLDNITGNKSLEKGNYDGKLWFNKTTTLAEFNPMPAQAHLRRSPSWKNPTFWGNDPILGKQNQKLTPSKWVRNRSPRIAQRKLSPNMAQVKRFIDKNFYSAKPEQRPTKIKAEERVNSRSKQKTDFAFYSNQLKDTPRFQKIKTYNSVSRNPILDPQFVQVRGKKIVKKASLSPNQNLIQNPKSNPLIYYQGNKKLTLSPKTNNKRNLSPLIKQVLSSSLEEKTTSPNRKSSKKHFAQYFRQNLFSKWG